MTSPLHWSRLRLVLAMALGWAHSAPALAAPDAADVAEDRPYARAMCTGAFDEAAVLAAADEGSDDVRDRVARAWATLASGGSVSEDALRGVGNTGEADPWATALTRATGAPETFDGTAFPGVEPSVSWRGGAVSVDTVPDASWGPSAAMFVIRVRIGGHPVLALIDTTQRRTRISAPLIGKLPQDGVGLVPDGPGKDDIRTLTRLVIGGDEAGLSIDRLEVGVMGDVDARFDPLEPDVIHARLGLDVLRHARWRLDHAMKEVRIQPSAGREGALADAGRLFTDGERLLGRARLDGRDALVQVSTWHLDTVLTASAGAEPSPRGRLELGARRPRDGTRILSAAGGFSMWVGGVGPGPEGPFCPEAIVGTDALVGHGGILILDLPAGEWGILPGPPTPTGRRQFRSHLGVSLAVGEGRLWPSFAWHARVGDDGFRRVVLGLAGELERRADRGAWTAGPALRLGYLAQLWDQTHLRLEGRGGASVDLDDATWRPTAGLEAGLGLNAPLKSTTPFATVSGVYDLTLDGDGHPVHGLGVVVRLGIWRRPMVVYTD